MSFEPENALEETLVRAGTDPLARPEFYRLLMETELVVLGRAEPMNEGKLDLQIGQLRHNGRDYLAVFSALSRLRNFSAKDEPHFTLGARPLFEATRGANFVLNPNAPYGKLLSAAEIAYWLDPSARTRRKLQRASEVQLADYAEPPPILVEALCLLFRNRQAVQGAWLLEATPVDGREPPHPLVGIETTERWSKIAGEVGELVEAIAPGTVLDLVQIDRGDAPDSPSLRIMQSPPLYIRTLN
ncbi:MAG: enhanced serine sensitivity protein SseB C-terminal domain-containing protein [Proteobacteria bacterium]|nr:enhanced serine sensitivity protein SseB C-terminal domain-containing protein [Pseudomonadota bacterium]